MLALGFDALQADAAKLEQAVAATSATEGSMEKAKAARDGILPLMTTCRQHADTLERLVDDALWPLPKYSELLWIH